MDFIKIIRSLEEFLYEVMTWILFYPRAMLNTVLHPLRTMRYARAELADPPDQQYVDSLSPPLVLLLTLALAHGAEMAAHTAVSDAPGLMGGLLRSPQNLVVVRALLFAVFPLTFAVEQLRLGAEPLNRESLRGPFFGQCYLAAVFALLLSLSATLMGLRAVPAQLGGLALTLLATAWFLVVEMVWFHEQFPGRPWRALAAVATAFAKAIALLAVAVFVLFHIG